MAEGKESSDALVARFNERALWETRLWEELNRRLSEIDKRYEQRFEAQEKALSVASDGSNNVWAMAVSLVSLTLSGIGVVTAFWMSN